MRRWRAAAGSALGVVADRPALWLAGGLAWVATVGWVPFVVAVVRPPTAAELTYLGTGVWTSGMWPLNVVLGGLALVALTVVLLAAAALGNAALVRAVDGRSLKPADPGRLLVPALLGTVPVAIGLLALLIALIAVGPAEFNRPQAEPGPMVRTAVRLAPIIVFTGVVGVLASTLAGLAGRAALRAGGVIQGIGTVAALVRRAGRAGLVHLAVSVAAAAAFLALAGLLVGVLWAPIRAQVAAGGGIDLAGGLLLVGFVAIWLCLVLAGGALHAWASATATLLLERRSANEPDRPQQGRA